MNLAYTYPAAMANGAGPEFGVEALENPVRFHRATILEKSNFIRFRRHKHRFGTGVDVVWGIKSPEHKGPRGGVVSVHAIEFDKRQFSPSSAKTWLRQHGYRPIRFEAAQPGVREREVAARPAIRKVANPMPAGAVFKYVASAVAANPTGQPPISIENATIYIQQGGRSTNPAMPALKMPPRVRVPAKHRGVTGLPWRAWIVWSEMQLANHFLALVPTYGPGMVNNWVKNIERWNRTKNPQLSAKAHRVRMLIEGSPRYSKLLGQPRGSFKKPNPSEVGRLCGIRMKNPSLMLLLNPRHPGSRCVASQKGLALAERAYKRFHFTAPRTLEKAQVPSGWPSCYVIIGACERFDVQDENGKKISRSFLHTNPMPKLATTKDMKDVFIFGHRPLGITAGRALRVDYRVAPHSGRNKWARRWWHPHESHPAVFVDRGGRAVRVSGPGLSVTPRGIVG